MRTNLELLLGDWGRWKAIEEDAACGFPRADAFMTERVDGGDGYDSGFVYAPLVDDDVRRVNVIINGLHADSRLMLMAHYIWSGPVKVKADRLRMTKAEYYFRLGPIHAELSHDMGGRYLTGHEPILSRRVEEVSRTI